MHFQTQLEKAIPTVCQLLGSKTISDVNESIEFFVVASEFGLQSAIIGVRRMLVLIWSRDTAVRDAVVEAYKGLYLDPEAPNARYMYILCTLKSLFFTSNRVRIVIRVVRALTMYHLVKIKQWSCKQRCKLNKTGVVVGPYDSVAYDQVKVE